MIRKNVRARALKLFGLAPLAVKRNNVYCANRSVHISISTYSLDLDKIK